MVFVVLLLGGAGLWWLGSGWSGWFDAATPAPVASAPAPGAESPDDLSTAELEQAEQEARYALAQIARISERTGLGVRDDVHRHLLAPTTRTFTDSMDTIGSLTGEPQ